MHEVDFVNQVRKWYYAHHGTAQATGIELTFDQSRDRRPKPAAWITATSGRRESNVVVWSSGEAELIAGEPGRLELSEHYDLESAEHLAELLDRLLTLVSS
jgi:hypothetical protein